MGESQGQQITFGAPPVEEVAIALNFEPLEMQGLHVGEFWREIRAAYPTVQEMPYMPQRLEQFSSPVSQPQIEFSFGPAEHRRYWFSSEDKTRLLQLQRDLLAKNWRKIRGDEVYPGYREFMRPELERRWGKLREFVQANRLGQLSVRQVEMTYVSAVPKGEGWNSYADLPRIVVPWSGKFSGNQLPEPETVGLSATFLIPGHKGRLSMTATPWIRPRDSKETIQFTTVSRVLPPNPDPAAVLGAVDVAHEWAVGGFAELTTPEMHEMWKRTR